VIELLQCCPGPVIHSDLRVHLLGLSVTVFAGFTWVKATEAHLSGVENYVNRVGTSLRLLPQFGSTADNQVRSGMG